MSTQTLASTAAIALSLACTLMLLALNLSGPPGSPGTLNGYGYKDIYAYHPVLMSLAFLLCFPLAMLSYVLELPSFARRWLPDERSRHVLHGGANLLGTLFTLSGFVLAFTYHEALGKVHTGLSGEVGTHRVMSRPAHIILGYIVIIGVFLQCVAGLCKHAVRAPSAALVLVHRRVGPALWVGGLVCIGLAAYFEYLEVPPQDKPHWDGAQLGAVLVGLVALGAAVLGLLALGARAGAGASEYKVKGGGEGAEALLLN